MDLKDIIINIINLTPHEIVLFHEECGEEEDKVVIPSSKLKVYTEWSRLHRGEGIPFPLYEVEYKIQLHKFSFLQNLDQFPFLDMKDKYFIVPAIVGYAVAEYVKKNDFSLPFHLISPDMERAVRDKQGRILGVRGFIFHV